MIWRKLSIVVLTSSVLFGCASSKISSFSAQGNTAAAPQTVRVIALSPDGKLMANAIANELVKRGFNVIDSETTAKMLARLSISEIELGQQSGRSKLHAEGVDALLTVKGAAAIDGRPISAIARLDSTVTGKVISNVTWENGWGGVAGSMADRTMRKGVSETAEEIAAELAKSIRPTN